MNVLIADKFEQSGLLTLEEIGCEVSMDASLKGDSLTRAIGRTACCILVVRSTPVTKAMMDASANLSVIIRAGSGYDTIDVEAATQRDIRVCNCPGMNSVAVAELTLGLMIALDRRIVDEAGDLRRGVWNKREYSKARGLKGRTLGIVGLGRIGYEVAKHAAAFEMKLVYSDLVEHPEWEKELDLRKTPLEKLLAEADFVSLHVPGGSETRHLIGHAELALMRPTAFLLNCSRGGLVDEPALGQALEAGVIAGAALDAFEIEPAPTDSKFVDPINKAPHRYGTHHVGASTTQAQCAVAEETVRIVRGYLRTGELIHCVNPPETVAETA